MHVLHAAKDVYIAGGGNPVLQHHQREWGKAELHLPGRYHQSSAAAGRVCQSVGLVHCSLAVHNTICILYNRTDIVLGYKDIKGL